MLIALLALEPILKEKSALAIFTLLTLAGLVGGHALLTGYTEEETWGPRYLHSSIAPLILCIGWTRDRLGLRSVAPVSAAGNGRSVGFVPRRILLVWSNASCGAGSHSVNP